MLQSLRDILADFVNKTKESIHISVIYSDEKENSKRNADMSHDIVFYKRKDTSCPSIQNHTNISAVESDRKHGTEEIVKLVTHIDIIREALRDKKEYMMILESDSSDIPFELVKGFLQSVKGVVQQFDIEGANEFLIFETDECKMWKPLTHSIRATNEFNGIKWYFIGLPMMEKVVGSYEYILRKNRMVSLECLFGMLLRIQNRWVLCKEKT